MSTPHRVVSRSGRERFSIPFILDANPDAVVACLPTCMNPRRPAKDLPLRAADDIRTPQRGLSGIAA